MEMKHTPGPWEVVRINERGQHTPDGKIWWVYAGNGNGWVGDSYMSSCLGSENDAEANARLIAAAPDLLDALKEARIDLSNTRANVMVELNKYDNHRWEGVPEALKGRIEIIDAIIAKATQP